MMRRRSCNIAGGPIVKDSKTFSNFIDNFTVDISDLDYAAGDLCLIGFSFTAGADTSWSWTATEGYIVFTPILSETGVTNPGCYIGQATLDGTDNLATTLSVSGFTALNGVVIILDGYYGYSYDTKSSTRGSSGMPNPPSLSGFSAGDISIIHSGLDNSSEVATAPAGYEIIGQSYVTAGNCTVAINISPSATEDPDALGGTGDDAWVATTIRLTR